MKIKIAGILMAAVLLVSISAAAQRQERTQGKENRKEMAFKRGMKPGGEQAGFLSADQKEAMKALRLETAKQIKPLKNELRELMARQQTLVTADKADLKAIDNNIDKISGVKAEMAKINAKQHQEFRSQLTEEQRLKFDSRKGKMHPSNNKSIRGKRMHGNHSNGFGIGS